MAARCAKHGLAVAPDGKCVRCKREEEEALATLEAPAPEAARRNRIIVAAIASALVAFVAAGGYAWKRRAESAPSAQAGASASAATPARDEAEAAPLSPLTSVSLPPDPKP